MPDILAFERVAIDYESRGRRQRIVDDLSFAIGHGETLGLVGESGCGKSTVALAALRYLPRGMRISSGRVLVEGRDIATLGDEEIRAVRGNRVAMVYQDPMSSLNPVMTIGRQLVEVPMLHGERDERAAFQRAVAMLGEVRLPDAEAMMARYPHQLSGGQQQRVVIAMALMAEPALLIMDEPTTGLDVTIEAAILELVRDLRRRFDAAILFISHNLGTVARVCDRVGVLYAGRMVELGGVRGVFRAPAHPYTRGLLGALPRLDGSNRHARLSPIEGTLEAEDRARIGCAFAPRCAHVVAGICTDAPIALAPVAGDEAHVARCARLVAVAASGDARAAPAGGAGEGEDAKVLLDVRGLGKRYELGGRFGGRSRRSVRAVEDASFAARAGGTLAIVGESGCGKSTLAKVLSGLLSASEGEALIGGVDIAMLPVDKRPRDLRRRIQMVFQNPDSTLNPSHSVEFALTRPLRVLGAATGAEARGRAERLLDQVRLPREMLRRLPHQLSGGQRQRVAIARALAGEPDLMIADEPVSALDVSVQAAIINLLADLLADSRLGLIVISHDLALVRHMADWIAVMYLGRIVQYGPADAIFDGPQHPYTAALLAAAPTPDPDAGAPEIVLAGAMPSPSATIVGCVFESRCPRRIAGLCETTPPPVRALAGGVTVACHLDFSPAPAEPR